MDNEMPETFTLTCGEDKMSANSWGNIAMFLAVAEKCPGDQAAQAQFSDGTLILFAGVKVDAGKMWEKFPKAGLPDWADYAPGETRFTELGQMGYAEYLQTPEWDAIRRRKRRQAGYRCQVCNASGVQLDVHHRTYENRGHELDEDLIVLCHECHGIFERAGKLKVGND